jgi:hypothetical protein
LNKKIFTTEDNEIHVTLGFSQDPFTQEWSYFWMIYSEHFFLNDEWDDIGIANLTCTNKHITTFLLVNNKNAQTPPPCICANIFSNIQNFIKTVVLEDKEFVKQSLVNEITHQYNQINDKITHMEQQIKELENKQTNLRTLLIDDILHSIIPNE